MYWTKKHVLVCTSSHCAQKGSNDLVGRLRLEIVRKKLDTEILVNTCGTIDLCDIGPNVIVYPDNIILSGVTVRDVPALVRFLCNEGDPPGEITSYDAPAEANRRTFYQSASSCGPHCATEQIQTWATDAGYDERWLDEQIRRGFLARKPDPETGEPTLTVTSKARDRYRVRADANEVV